MMSYGLARENCARRADRRRWRFGSDDLLLTMTTPRNMLALNSFRFGIAVRKADGEVVGEMIAADGHSTGVPHDSATVHDDFRCAAPNIEQAAARSRSSCVRHDSAEASDSSTVSLIRFPRDSLR